MEECLRWRVWVCSFADDGFVVIFFIGEHFNKVIFFMSHGFVVGCPGFVFEGGCFQGWSNVMMDRNTVKRGTGNLTGFGMIAGFKLFVIIWLKMIIFCSTFCTISIGQQKRKMWTQSNFLKKHTKRHFLNNDNWWQGFQGTKKMISAKVETAKTPHYHLFDVTARVMKSIQFIWWE